MESHIEKQDGDVLQKSFKEMISTLPKGNSWGFPGDVYQYQGFWFSPPFLQGALLAQQQFQAQPTDIILCSSPRTGAAWLKSLTFSTITRTTYDDSTTPLLSKMPHDVVPYMEFDHIQFSTNRHLGIPLLATHLPYSFLPRSIIDSGCKLIYICRDPKDTFVSLYHIIARYNKSQNTQPIQLDEARFKKASVNLAKDTVLYLKKIAEFMGYPFSSEEQQQNVPENIVKMCSFDNLSGLEVNKTRRHREGYENLRIENNIFFRKGKPGDWKNYLTTKMAQRLDQRTMQKWSSSGLSV
ncbi:flavonol sulfotransferase-like [Gossypium hirsutum]|uniref:Sulfotransferase n=1 Tax=Gossypium hirsutum TaxID=3635 RepID=A0A1U8M3V2_GOSHI|nr:flavonol sulfotransferase-like [Gossypium hirsutum]